MAARVNVQTGDYAIQPQDDGKLVLFNSSSAVTVTLPQPGHPDWLGVSFVFWIANIGTGNLTITPTSSTIDGADSLVLTTNEGVQLFTDGSNYFSVRGTGSGGGSSLTLQTNGTDNGSQTLLNLAAGSNVTITDGGSGTVTIASSGGGGGSSGLPGEASLTAPVLSSFTEDNFGESTTASTITAGGVTAVVLSDPGIAGNNNSLRSLLVPIPTPDSPWTLTARLRFDTVLTNFMSFGIVLKDTTSGKYQLYGWGADVGIIQETDWNDANSFNTDFEVYGDIYGSSFPTEGWWRWQYDGTNLNYLWSRDGNAFALLRQTAFGSIFLPNAPSEAGIGMNINNNITFAPINAINLVCLSFSLTQP